MKVISRETLTDNPAFDLARVARVMRMPLSSDDGLLPELAAAAAREIEESGHLALLEQVIEVETTGVPDTTTLALPIGPLLEGAFLEVETIAANGDRALWQPDYWVTYGLRPAVHLAELPTTRLGIAYVAGFGGDHSSIPDDLHHAIADHTTRLFDQRGAIEDKHHTPGLSPHAARIVNRYRAIKVHV